MEVKERTLLLGSTVWVQHGGVDAEVRGDRLALTGRDDDSYVKVLNHFGRVLKLYTFEGGRWVDADTGGPAQPFDESQAGHVDPAHAPAPAAKPASARGRPSAKGAKRGKPAAGAASKRTGKSAGKSAGKVEGKAGSKPAARRRAK